MDDASANSLEIPDTLIQDVELEIETREEEWQFSPTLDRTTLLLDNHRKLVDYSSSSDDNNNDDEEQVKFNVQWGGGKGGVVRTRLQERREREKSLSTENVDNGGFPIVEDDGDNLGLPLVPITNDDDGDNLALSDVPFRENSQREKTPDPPALPNDPNPIVDIERGESSQDVERRASSEEEEEERKDNDDVGPAERQGEKDDLEEYFVIRPAATKIFKKQLAKTFSFTPVNFDETGLTSPSIDYATQLDNLNHTVIKFVTRQMQRHYPRGVKVHLSASVRFRVIRDEEIVDKPTYHFSVKSQLVLHLDEVPVVMGDIIRQLRELIADRKDRGSNFVFDTITDAQLTVLKFTPKRPDKYK